MGLLGIESSDNELIKLKIFGPFVTKILMPCNVILSLQIPMLVLLVVSVNVDAAESKSVAAGSGLSSQDDLLWPSEQHSYGKPRVSSGLWTPLMSLQRPIIVGPPDSPVMMFLGIEKAVLSLKSLNLQG